MYTRDTEHGVHAQLFQELHQQLAAGQHRFAYPFIFAWRPVPR
jgi:hypothetical protein